MFDLERENIVVDIDKLKPSPFNTFKIIDMDELENDIRTYGLLTPLSVIGPNENDEYIILCGERRYRVLKKLNEETPELYNKIPCLLLGPITMDEKMQQLIIEISNVSARTFDQTPHRMKIVSLLKELAESGEIRKSSIAKRAAEYCKISKKYARYYINIFDSDNEELKEKVEKKEISIENAGKIAKMPKEAQRESLDAINAGQSATKTIAQYEEKKRKKKNNPSGEDLKNNTEQIDEKEENSDTNPEPICNNEQSVTEEIDDFGYDINFFKSLNNEMDSSVDTTGEITKLKKEHHTGIGYYEESPELPEVNDAKLQDVLTWSAEILEKDNLTDDEMHVIKKLKEVVDKFL